MPYSPRFRSLAAFGRRPWCPLTGPRWPASETHHITRLPRPKQLELLHKLAPAAHVIGLLINPTSTLLVEPQSRDLQAATSALGLQLHVLHAEHRTRIGRSLCNLDPTTSRRALDRWRSILHQPEQTARRTCAAWSAVSLTVPYCFAVQRIVEIRVFGSGTLRRPVDVALRFGTGAEAFMRCCSLAFG